MPIDKFLDYLNSSSKQGEESKEFLRGADADRSENGECDLDEGQFSSDLDSIDFQDENCLDSN